MFKPTVSIGIPTYNRASKLERAVRSALQQTYAMLEVVVVDNASTDETEQLCRRLEIEDNRLRYIKQSTNIGPTRNFDAARELSSGEFFMWLGDDDWIDPDYIERCLEFLEDDRCVLAGGLSIYVESSGKVRAGQAVDICGETPEDRILDYYARVKDNALFYGLYRRAVLGRTPLKTVLAADWLVVAEALLTGTARTAAATRIWREIGASASFEGTLRVMNAPGWYRYAPYGVIAKTVFAEIARESRRFSEAIPSAWRRFQLASRVAGSIVRRHGLGGPTLNGWLRARAKRLILGGGAENIFGQRPSA